jgi:hypothetical protein
MTIQVLIGDTSPQAVLLPSTPVAVKGFVWPTYGLDYSLDH